MINVEKEFLEKIKNNIISWYQFKKDAEVLIIGNNIDHYKFFLESKVKKVDEFININTDQYYDYILIFDRVDLIQEYKQNLKSDGTILLCVNNKVGIKNFSILENIKNIQHENKLEYTKKQIEECIEKCGFTKYKFYYPLPNYETANVIFSDDYIPEYTNTKLVNNYYYPENNRILFKEIEVIKEITKVGEFKQFTNSYFVEINNISTEKFIGFNNTRKDEFILITKIFDNYVQKECLNEQAYKHIENMKKNIDILNERNIKCLDYYENSKIYSKYRTEKNLYQVIVDYILSNQIENAKKYIKNFFEFIKNKFENDRVTEINKSIFDNNEDLSNLTIIKNGLMDMVFENAFFIEDEFYFFDQEWNVENIPLEFIYYRAINNMYVYNSELQEKLLKEELYKEYNLDRYLDIFIKAEKNIQNIIVDIDKIKVYENSNNQTYLEKIENELVSYKNDNDYLNETNKCLESNLNEYKERIKTQENIINEYKNIINDLENKNKELENKNKELEKKNKELENVTFEQKIIIQNKDNELNEKQLTINYYENMRVVKFVKKIKNGRN